MSFVGVPNFVVSFVGVPNFSQISIQNFAGVGTDQADLMQLPPDHRWPPGRDGSSVNSVMTVGKIKPFR